MGYFSFPFEKRLTSLDLTHWFYQLYLRPPRVADYLAPGQEVLEEFFLPDGVYALYGFHADSKGTSSQNKWIFEIVNDGGTVVFSPFEIPMNPVPNTMADMRYIHEIGRGKRIQLKYRFSDNNQQIVDCITFYIEQLSRPT